MKFTAFVSSAGTTSFLSTSHKNPLIQTRVSTYRLPVTKQLQPVSNPFQKITMTTTDQSTKPTAKELAKLYGASYFGTSVTMALTTFLMLYAMVEVGIDVRALINSLGDFLANTPLGRPAVLDKIPDGVSAGLLAYLANKAISPIRFPLTIAATPFVAKVFSKKTDSEQPPSST